MLVRRLVGRHAIRLMRAEVCTTPVPTRAARCATGSTPPLELPWMEREEVEELEEVDNIVGPLISDLERGEEKRELDMKRDI